jgi:hypothetical protein
VQAWAHAKKWNGNTNVGISQKLVKRMMTNKPNNNGVAVASHMRTLVYTSSKHVFVKQQKNEGSWNPHTHIVFCENHCTSPIRAPNVVMFVSLARPHILIPGFSHFTWVGTVLGR